MKRADRALRSAPAATALARLPRAVLAEVVHREHADRPREDRGCWWFASVAPLAEPSGRFDLPAPRGTLYVAETAGAAARERCGRFLAAGTPIPEDDVYGRVVSRITASLSGLGDLTSPDAATVGVTGEIHTVDDYRLTTTWSAAADAAGFSGLRYTPRFTREERPPSQSSDRPVPPRRKDSLWRTWFRWPTSSRAWAFSRACFLARMRPSTTRSTRRIPSCPTTPGPAINHAAVNHAMKLHLLIELRSLLFPMARADTGVTATASRQGGHRR